MYRIGEVAALTGLSVKTLRHYDELALLAPEAIDHRTRYRRYSDADVERARQIVALKGLGFSLAEIARALDARAATRAVLEEARRRLIVSVDRQRRELADVEARLAALDDVALVACPAVRVASIRDRIATYSDADELFRELAAAVRGTGPDPIRGALWHRCDGYLEAEVFVVATGLTLRGRATDGELPPITAARTTASDDDWPAAYARLDQWVRDRGCTRAGPKRELLTTDPFSGACRLEILFPIEA